MTMWSCCTYAEFDTPSSKDKYPSWICPPAGKPGRRGIALRCRASQPATRNPDPDFDLDSQPADTDYYGTEAEADLRGIKREYTNKGIFDVCGGDR